MKFSFRVPAGKDMLWTDEAAESIVGKETNFAIDTGITYPTEVTAAHVEDKGKSLVIEVDVKIEQGV